MNDTNDNKTLTGQGSGTNGKPAPTDKEREKAKKECLLRQKAARETETFKRRYFEYYDDIKHSYREDW